MDTDDGSTPLLSVASCDVTLTTLYISSAPVRVMEAAPTLDTEVETRRRL
uniref:Uncharacterized protein n=1 Tax=Hyaloperonospora arabidopsidis (strain Emoy2) TaxID=559515 RepID=M4BQ85_HYAAE